MANKDTHSIESWLRRSAQGNLKQTVYGIDKDKLPVSDLVFDDSILRLVYIIDLASFIQGERISLEAVANAMTFAPDEKSVIYLSTQALDEARHLETFMTRMGAIGVENPDDVVGQFTSEKVVKLHDLVREQIDKKDFTGVVIALNVILEGLAFPTYRYERQFWSRLDPGMADLVNRAYFDEANHVGFGLNHLKGILTLNHRLKDGIHSLLQDFKKIVTEALDEAKANQARLYGEVIKRHLDRLRDVEVFPKRTFSDTSMDAQMSLLKQSIERQFEKNLHFIGVA